MKLYLDCSMGASGDMLMAALYELLPDKSAFRGKMERLGLPGVTYEYMDSKKCGIKGTHITVKVDGIEESNEHMADRYTIHDFHDQQHMYSHGDYDHDYDYDYNYDFNNILDLIRSLDLPGQVIEDAISVYIIIGEAEATVHGGTPDTVHLDEVGSLDAVDDIVGCCLLISLLGVVEITASPVHTGSGFIRCAHGVLPVPAPATAEILKGIPVYGGSIKGELCTPTGAALLKHFVTRFGEMTPSVAVRIGYGMGAKDFAAANCLRAFLCEDGGSGGEDRDDVYEISCNLDDMTPEAVSAVFGLLFENGALDVYATPIYMKKNRPAVMLSCLCEQETRGELTRLMLEHTSTLGVRTAVYHRDVLSRTVKTVSTEYGDIRVKRAEGFGLLKYKPEYDDVLAAAYRSSVPFVAVFESAMRAARCEK